MIAIIGIVVNNINIIRITIHNNNTMTLVCQSKLISANVGIVKHPRVHVGRFFFKKKGVHQRNGVSQLASRLRNGPCGCPVAAKAKPMGWGTMCDSNMIPILF
jgi:hypothetical protein